MTRPGIGERLLSVGLRAVLAGGLATILLGPAALAQSPPPAAPAEEQALAQPTPAQLDRLTAPIALYPDPLVAQILVAATYPLEVVEADRWLRQPEHAAMKGDKLAAALAPLRWDASVKYLAAFPQILAMMDKYLDWTEQLGDVFLAAQAAVMDAVQRLRRRAEAAGGLASSPEEVVSQEGGPIVIEPATPDTVYVPVYDPNLAFGEWPYPDNPPYYFPDVYPVATGGIPWIAVIVVEQLRPHRRCDWRRHRIDIDAARLTALGGNHPPMVPSVWQHDPVHRRGVPYRDPLVRARFEAAATAGRVQAVSRQPAVSMSLSRPAPAIGHPTPVTAGRPAAPHIVQAPAVGTATPPVVLRGSPPVAQTFHRVPEVPTEGRLAPAIRPSASAPTAIMQSPAAPAPAVVPHVPHIAPPPHLAPAPALRAAPVPDGMIDRR